MSYYAALLQNVKKDQKKQLQNYDQPIVRFVAELVEAAHTNTVYQMKIVFTILKNLRPMSE